MNLKHLEQIVAISRFGGFSGAADDFFGGDRDQPGSPASVARDGFPVDPR